MKTGILDVETTTILNGHPFHPKNKLCVIGLREIESGIAKVYKIEYDENPYGDQLTIFAEDVARLDCLVGFNIKFDLHWLKRYGIDISKYKLWDCQVVDFILGDQRDSFSSLDDVAGRYALPKKLSVVEEYWNAGIDTTQIPWEILCEYLEQDLLITQLLYEKQKAELENQPKKKVLSKVACYDTKVLQEIEYNGMLCNARKIKQMEEELSSNLERLDKELLAYFPGIPLNINSGDHLSACLYGGTILEVVREPNGVYKSGPRAGQTRYSLRSISHTLPRLIEPLPRSKLKKPGFFSTDESTLRRLVGKASPKVRNFINTLLERAEIEKRLSTYIRGFQELVETHSWKNTGDKFYIHGQLNQCAVITGRLSSSKPNLQNIDKEIKDVFISRF